MKFHITDGQGNFLVVDSTTKNFSWTKNANDATTFCEDDATEFLDSVDYFENLDIVKID